MAEKPKMQKSLEDEETTDVDESENNDSSNESDDESEKEIVIPEPLAPNRGRRHNAGNKMAELLNSAVTSDEFYETAYGGGFKEVNLSFFNNTSYMHVKNAMKYF